MNKKLFLIALLSIGFIGSVSGVDITSCSDLQSLSSSNSYNVKNDIDCNGQTIDTIATTSWSNTFDGNGYTIANFSIKEDANNYGYDDQGFIHGSRGGTVKDLTFSNGVATFEESSATGLIVGSYGDGSTISGVTIKDVTVNITNSNGNGGMIFGGYNGWSGSNNVKKIIIDDSELKGSGADGAIARDNEDITVEKIIIKNSDFNGANGLYDYTAGTTNNYLVRNNTGLGTVFNSNSYNSASAKNGFAAEQSTSSSYFGSTPSTTSDNYYDTGTTGISDPDATGLTTSDMQGSSASNNMNFDFSNTWTTQSNDYPTLLFSLEPKVTQVDSPSDNIYIDQGVNQDFNFTINSGGQSATVELKVKYPNGTTITEYSDSVSSGTAKSYSRQLSFNTLGNYDWYVDVGSDTSQTRSFEVIDYSKPSISLDNPNDGEEFKTYNDKVNNVEFSFSANSDIDGSYEIQQKNQSDPNSSYSSILSGSISSGSNAYLSFLDLNLTSDLDQRDWRVQITDDIDGGVSGSSSFTLNKINPPNISLEEPQDQEVFYIENGGTVDIPVEGWINNSEESGTAKGDRNSNTFPYSENLGTVNQNDNQYFTGTYTATTDGSFSNFHIEFEGDNTGKTYESGKNSVDVLIADPQITNFNVTPSITDVQPNESFDVQVDGAVNRDSIDRIEYDLSVNGNLEEEVTKNPIDFQDQNQFTDSMNQFSMKDQWQGDTIKIEATVYDTQGLNDTASSSADTSTPPNGFIQNSPNNNQVFLIPEGDSEIPVEFDYGVDTAERGGTVELIVNSNVEDSFSASANSQATQTFEKNYTSDDYQWFVRFTDAQDGKVYESNTYTFDVTDEPINLNLQSPSGGEQIDLVNQTEKDIDHNFEVDARAFNSQYYYEFELNNSDTSSTILSRTSSNFDTGVADYTESASALDEGNYSWSVEVYQSSDDKLLESGSTTYSLKENPLFSQDILSPVEGETFFLNETNQMDVNTTYEAKAESSNVDLTLFLDGNQVDTNTVSAGNYSTFDNTLFDVAEGDHTLKLMGEDGDGRVQNTSVNFEVAQPKETSIEFTEISTDPPLDEANVGDEVDVYIEGSGNVDDVDYLQVDITVGGEVIDTKIIDTDNLQSGSWFITLEDAFTVTEDMIGKAASIKGYAESVAGDAISYVYDVLGIGSNRDISVSLNAPSDGRTFEQNDGDADDIRYEFDISTINDPVDYSIQIRPNGSTNYKVLGTPSGTVSDGATVEEFRNMESNSKINQQFGVFDWKVNISEQGSQKTDESETRSYTIRKNSSEPILNFNNPEDYETIYAGANSDSTDVQFQWDVDTIEEGTTTLEIDDYSREFDHPTGFSQRKTSLNLPLGSYVANLSFESDSYSVEKQHEFSIKQEQNQTDSPYVELNDPPDGITAYKKSDIEREFGWTVANFVDSGSGEGNSTLYIENANNNVVESFSRDYDTQNEPQSYAEIYSFSNLNVGTYDWYVEFEADQMSKITSNKRSFEVKQFQPPVASLFQPDNQTFTEDEYPEFEWRVESFDESPTVELRYREKGEYKSEVLFDSAQDSNAVRDYSFNESQFTRGEYEWFIRMQPDQYQEFDSNINTFTVEPEEINEPEITLDIPEQDEIFEIKNGSDSATIEFNYFVELYSDNNAQVDLMLQNASEDSTSDYYSIQREFQNVDDGNITYNHLENLKENGYRYKVKVEYPNGQKEESEVRSFIVDDPETEETPDIPDPEPTEGFFNEGAILFGNLIDSYKSAVGGVGQMFTAFMIIAIAAGLTQLAFRMETLSLIVATFGTLGFALADGFLPVSFFWIVLALSAGLAALTGRSILGGGDS